MTSMAEGLLAERVEDLDEDHCMFGNIALGWIWAPIFYSADTTTEMKYLRCASRVTRKSIGVNSDSASVNRTSDIDTGRVRDHKKVLE